MRTVSMIKYRMYRYFYSSRPVIPVIAIFIFSGIMYSMRPLDICSGYVLSGIFLFILSTFVTMGVSGSEETVEEQLLLLHGSNVMRYCVAREIQLLTINCLYGVLLALAPVIQNCMNQFAMFKRPLEGQDILWGTLVIIGSGIAGTAVGDMFHPRILGERKMALTVTVGMMILSIVKDGMIDKYAFLRLPCAVFPSIMKPARDVGGGDYFQARATIVFLLMMTIYYLIVSTVKNLIVIYRKF